MLSPAHSKTKIERDCCIDSRQPAGQYSVTAFFGQYFFWTDLLYDFPLTLNLLILLSNAIII